MDRRTLKNQIANLETLEGLTHAYAQISSNRMGKIRFSVLSNRDFLQELEGIFKDLRLSYKSEVKKLLKKKGIKKGEKVTFLAHNGKVVNVFLSANTGLYGELVPSVFRQFLKDTQSQNAEGTIIGKLGLSLFLGSGVNIPYTYFDFPDYGIDPARLSEIISHLVQYEKIRIYHGKFVNLVKQEPAVFDLVAETPVAKFSLDEKEEKITKFLFEPDLNEILMFFETEMFGSLLEQTLKESQLAKFASRMFAMDQAGENIKGILKKMRLAKLRLTHYLANKTQLNSMSANLKAIKQYG